MHAFVTAHFGYYYSILVRVPDAAVQKLKLLQNLVAHLVSKTGRLNISLILLWTCIGFQYRIDFNIIILIYKAVLKLAPPYISNILQIYLTRTHVCRIKLIVDTAGQTQNFWSPVIPLYSTHIMESTPRQTETLSFNQ